MKTAVEWLIEQIKSDQYQKALSLSEWMKVFEQAKAMEKEQIVYFVDNLIVGMSREKIEKYYNETFKQE